MLFRQEVTFEDELRKGGWEVTPTGGPVLEIPIPLTYTHTHIPTYHSPPPLPLFPESRGQG